MFSLADEWSIEVVASNSTTLSRQFIQFDKPRSDSFEVIGRSIFEHRATVEISPPPQELIASQSKSIPIAKDLNH